ncbi:hypothetical protein ABZY09_30580 [Streptomyces sp. NPDC002928]|uniref:hypothetical protein n=1 Tax=Streptomyces sp. NPDC002928 TaxID=3154440 RepID=UPI0033AB6BA2
MVTKPTRGQPDWDVTLNAALDDLQGQVTTNGSAVSAVSTRVTILENQGETRASDMGLLLWTGDPAYATATTTLTSGTVYTVKLNVRQAMTATNLIYSVFTAGSTLTSGQNFVGLYDSSGNRVAVSADQTSNWGSLGTMVTPFTAPVALTPGAYFAAWLSNGTTPITLTRGTGLQSAMVNVNQTAATYRYTTGGTGWSSLTALPAPGVMANRSIGGFTFWCAIS